MRATPAIVVVGAGTGGTMVANLLRKRLGNETTITVVAETSEHVFQPANLDVAFKGAPPERFVRQERPLLKHGIRLVVDPVAKIDPLRNTVRLRSGEELGYDALVLATGAVADPTLTPGLAEHALNFHTGPRNAARIWRELRDLGGGRVVVAIAGVPYKCPPSPVEAVFLLDEHFRHRRMRERVEIRLVTPYPRAYPAATIADIVEPRLATAGIPVTTLFNMDGVDAQKKVITSLEGEEVPYDLLIAVPPHRGVDFLRGSELADEEGWIKTDKETMRVDGTRNVFALGDATNIPISKSGVVAHLQADVVAENVARQIEDDPRGDLAFEGRINCPMEVGDRRALFVSATYTRPPIRQRPTYLRYAMKKSFGRMYWTVLGGDLEWMFSTYFGRTHHEKASPTEA